MQLLNLKNIAVAALVIYPATNAPSVLAIPTDQGFAPATVQENIARENIMTTAKYQLSSWETPSVSATGPINATTGVNPSATFAALTSDALKTAVVWPIGLLTAGGAVMAFL